MSDGTSDTRALAGAFASVLLNGGVLLAVAGGLWEAPEALLFFWAEVLVAMVLVPLAPLLRGATATAARDLGGLLFALPFLAFQGFFLASMLFGADYSTVTVRDGGVGVATAGSPAAWVAAAAAVLSPWGLAALLGLQASRLLLDRLADEGVDPWRWAGAVGRALLLFLAMFFGGIAMVGSRGDPVAFLVVLAFLKCAAEIGGVLFVRARASVA